MDLDQRLIQLDKALAAFKPQDQASWQLAQIFNALLEEVKKQASDDPVLAVLQPVEEAYGVGVSASDCGTLRASVAQLRQVLAGH